MPDAPIVTRTAYSAPLRRIRSESRGPRGLIERVIFAFNG